MRKYFRRKIKRDVDVTAPSSYLHNFIIKSHVFVPTLERIMLKFTYSISNSGEPAKVSSGMMDRLLFIIILKDKQKHRNNKKENN